MVVIGFFLILFSSIASYGQIPSSLGWYEIPNTKLSPVCEQGPGTCGSVISAWNSGVMDTFRNRLIIWGGGHHDYNGNEIYSVNLTGTPSAVRLNNSTASGCSDVSCDGGSTPNGRHTYGGIAYMPSVDSMFVFSGSLAGNGYGFDDTWEFSFGTNKWQMINGKGGARSQGVTESFGADTAWDPNTGKLFVSTGDDLFYYDPVTHKYTKKKRYRRQLRRQRRC